MNYTKQLLIGLMLASGITANADAPAGYYNALDGQKDVALMRAAKNAVINHTAISYSGGTWDAFATTDVTYYNGEKIWWDMYSNDICKVSTGHGGLNVEHSVANSWWGGTKNDAYKDLFHLNPSNADANSRKSNYPLSEIATVTWTNGVTSVGKPVSGQGGGSTYVYEPPKQYKGDFARAFMYIFTVYNDINWQDKTNWMYDASTDLMFKPWAVELLLKWAKEDPVSQKEIDRNEAIYAVQKNRNPFIDFPELCEYIWGSKKGQAFSITGAAKPDPGTDPDPDSDPDPDPKPDPTPDPVAGDWMLVQSKAELVDDADYIVVSEKNYNAMGYENTQSGSAAYLVTTGQAIPTNNIITKLPSDAAVVRFTPQGSSYLIGVYDQAHNFKGYMNCTTAKKVTLENSISNATPVNLTIISGITVVDFGDGGKLQYNPQAPRFTTYTASSQEGLSLYRHIETNVISSMQENTFRFTLEGNNIIAPVGTMVFDMQGRQMGMYNLTPGIYVVTDGINRAKVMVK